MKEFSFRLTSCSLGCCVGEKISLPSDYKEIVLEELKDSDILIIEGGEPFCSVNIEKVYDLVMSVRIKFPKIKIFLHSNFNFNLENRFYIEEILQEIDGIKE